MPVLNFRKVNALPDPLEPTTLYMIRDTGNKLQFCLTDKQGSAIWKTHSVTELSQLITLLIENQKGQPGGLAYLDENGNIVGGSVTPLSALDGQNGDIRSNNAYVWKTVTEQLIYRNLSGGNNPTWGTLFANQQGLLFDVSGITQTWCDISFGNDVAIGSNFRLSIPFTVLNNSSGFVRFGIEYHIAKAFGQSQFSSSGTTIIIDTPVTANQPRKVYNAMSPEINGAIAEPGTILKMRIYRDGSNDSHGYDVHANVVNLHHRIARLGTRNYMPAFLGI